LTVPDPLKGLCVLVVEDEALIAMLMEEQLKGLGCEVIGVASTLKEGMEKALRSEIDASVLDVNLNGEVSYPIAQALRARSVPIVFATGYGVGGLPENLSDAPVVVKPFRQAQVADALRKALETASAPAR